MKAGNGKHFEEAYNAQADGYDTEGSMLIVGGYVTNHANDKEELSDVVESIPDEVRKVSNVSADTGYFSEKQIDAVEKREIDNEGNETLGGPEVICAVAKQDHSRSVESLEEKPEVPKPDASAPLKERMEHKLQTPEGKAIYKKRKETVEPVLPDNQAGYGV